MAASCSCQAFNSQNASQWVLGDTPGSTVITIHHKADSMHAITNREEMPKNKERKLLDTLSDSEGEDNQISHAMVCQTRVNDTLALYWNPPRCTICAPLSY
ncbi:unnamed protein product [Lepeophtheirus salmonis]|uniref:(salmon louse) hypothetical protein n=1 Tax=Lepeophtheirus salmonis TaxID=72036 RepID=A0A7R8CZE3_LEPSM|nr:unnamed protein product [Lepeophtheirus salmonis]CAF2975491.1 unnamed protein product [Lepeophtheirus salmonis]